jgi:hypothetical protein
MVKIPVDFPLDSAYTGINQEKSRYGSSGFKIERLGLKKTKARASRAFFSTFIHFERRSRDMDYGMIGKIDKAKRYAAERDRIRFESLAVTFDGKNNPHQVSFKNGTWQCDCDFFQTRGRCSHTMALEMILEKMLPEPSVE